MRYFACLLLLLSWAAEGEEVTDCSRIENADERLVCFDGIFPNEDDTSTAPETGTDTPRVADQVQTGEPAPAPRVSSQSPDTTKHATDAKSDGHSLGTIFGKDPAVDLTTTIKSIRRRDQQKMVFLLENDEIWLQATPRQLPFHEGDMVTIENAFLGGYFMKSESGTSTRVRRIK